MKTRFSQEVKDAVVEEMDVVLNDEGYVQPLCRVLTDSAGDVECEKCPWAVFDTDGCLTTFSNDLTQEERELAVCFLAAIADV